MEDSQNYNQTNQIKIIKQSRYCCWVIVTLKPDEGNDVTLISNADYILTAANLLTDTNKF